MSYISSSLVTTSLGCSSLHTAYQDNLAKKQKFKNRSLGLEQRKKEIVDKAELAEDEETIAKNILFEVDHTPGGQSAESDVIDLKSGTYIVGCHIPGHYEAGMKGTLTVN